MISNTLLQGNKVALCLCGGGAHGIWGAGAAEAVKDFGIEWEGLIGSSVGTLNGLLIHQNKWSDLKDLWMNVKSSSVYNKFWFWGLGKVSLYDTEPLRKLLSSYTDLGSIRSNRHKFIISTTNFNTGTAEEFEINELADSEVVDVLLASASPPVFFPPVKFRDTYLVDAGVVNNFGITTAVKAGFETLIVIKYPKSKMKPVLNQIDALTNSLSAAMDSSYDKEKAAIEEINNVISTCDKYDPALRYRKIIEICSQGNELDYDFLDFDFKGKNREQLWQQGYNRAMEVLKVSL